MSEPHAEPPAADVRSFLPRPGEPVEDYAARLRALHHDLSLVLDAVERGLAAAEAAPPSRLAPVAEPLGEIELEPRRSSPPFADPTEPRRSPPPPATLTSPRGGARVEVISTPRPSAGGGEGGEGAWSGPQEPEGAAPWGGRRAPMGEGAPVGGDPVAPSPERWPHEPRVEAPPRPPRSEPWVERGDWAPSGPAAPWAEGERTGPWPEGERSGWPSPPRPPAQMTYEPPPYAPYTSVARRVPSMPPVVLAAAILGWLTVLALILALALGAD